MKKLKRLKSHVLRHQVDAPPKPTNEEKKLIAVAEAMSGYELKKALKELRDQALISSDAALNFKIMVFSQVFAARTDCGEKLHEIRVRST